MRTFATQKHAVVAQLVEHWLPKPRVAGSSPVYRSTQATKKINANALIFYMAMIRMSISFRHKCA